MAIQSCLACQMPLETAAETSRAREHRTGLRMVGELAGLQEGRAGARMHRRGVSFRGAATGFNWRGWDDIVAALHERRHFRRAHRRRP